MRADCRPSSLDSKAEERKYVSIVPKANGYTKTFLRNCRKPVATSSTPDEREPTTGFAVIPYTQATGAGGVRTLIALHHGRNTKSESFASCRSRVNIFGGSKVA